MNTVYFSLEEAFEFCWGPFANEHNTLQNWPGEMLNWRNLHWEPHDYWIYYVNIDLRHQYGISIAESQTFLLAKRPKRWGARRNSCFHRLDLWLGVQFWDFGGWGWWNVPFTTITVKTTRVLLVISICVLSNFLWFFQVGQFVRDTGLIQG